MVILCGVLPEFCQTTFLPCGINATNCSSRSRESSVGTPTRLRALSGLSNCTKPHAEQSTIWAMCIFMADLCYKPDDRDTGRQGRVPESDGSIVIRGLFDEACCASNMGLWRTRLQATAPLIRPCCHLLLSPLSQSRTRKERNADLST